MNWISVTDDLPKGPASIVKVKRENGDELKAYYHSDSVAWASFYGVKTSKFQSHETKDFLFDVTHWRPLSTSPEMKNPFTKDPYE